MRVPGAYDCDVRMSIKGKVTRTSRTAYFRVARNPGLASSVVRSETTWTAHSCCLRRFGACEANFLSRNGLRLRRSLSNKICDRSWLRYVDSVASLDLNDRSTRALGHGTLGVRWNHPVLGGEQIPARLRPPRGFADRAANGPQAPRNLGCLLYTSPSPRD